MKLASNTRFWEGLTQQTVQYLTSEEVKSGYFVYIIHHERHDQPDFRERARALAAEASHRAKVTIQVIGIDARQKLSASKLREDGKDAKDPPSTEDPSPGDTFESPTEPR